MNHITGWFLAAVFTAMPVLAAAQDFPNRTIRIFVGFAPGGGTDTLARFVGQGMTEVLGQPVVVENRPGASTQIATELVAKAPADGYTLVLGAPQTLTINPQIFANLPFDPQKELAPIAVIASVPNVLVVTNKLPVKTPQDLIAYAKANPGKLNYGSSSIGGTPHLSAEMFKAMTDTSIVHVPYKGSAPAVQDLVGGQIEMMFDNLPAALPQIRAGNLRALAVTTLKRSPSAPELPTLDESGLKGFDSQGWFALLAPVGTPAAILEKINAEVNKALATPEFRERLQAVGAEPVGGTIDDFKQRIRQETERWAKVIKFANIKAQ